MHLEARPTRSELPRERIARHGPEPLGEDELLALVLGGGGRAGSALQLARGLLSRCGGLPGLARAPLPALHAVRGIGSARAAAVIAALELGKRLVAAPPANERRFLCSADVFEVYHPRLRHCPQEVFLALALDGRNRCQRELTLARGGGGACAVTARDVFRDLLAGGAAAVIFVHNHPSGDPSPSPEDRELTAKLCAAGELLGLRVLDHVIVGDGRYASLADRGELRAPATGRRSSGSSYPGRVGR